MLRKEKKWNYVKCLIKPQNTEKEWMIEIGKKNKSNKQKTWKRLI